MFILGCMCQIVAHTDDRSGLQQNPAEVWFHEGGGGKKLKPQQVRTCRESIYLSPNSACWAAFIFSKLHLFAALHSSRLSQRPRPPDEFFGYWHSFFQARQFWGEGPKNRVQFATQFVYRVLRVLKLFSCSLIRLHYALIFLPGHKSSFGGVICSMSFPSHSTRLRLL